MVWPLILGAIGTAASLAQQQQQNNKIDPGQLEKGQFGQAPPTSGETIGSALGGGLDLTPPPRRNLPDYRTQEHTPSSSGGASDLSGMQEAIKKANVAPDADIGVESAVTPPPQDVGAADTSTATAGASGGGFADVLGKLAMGAKVAGAMKGRGGGGRPLNFGSAGRFGGGQPTSAAFMQQQQRQPTIGQMAQRMFRR